ncbi:MAG: DUF1565 domain-containing protein [Xanthomonadales bacterium]|nr:DUF1565 domain-containing protein [Xanthomonadales bacterium]
MFIRFIPRPRSALLMGLAVAALASHCVVQASTYLVGSDGLCDYSTVQEAINGAASHPGPDSIQIANNTSYSQQALVIGSQDLIIEGGFANCGSATSTGLTILNGAGGAAAPVIRISGSGVRDFRRLTIRGGDSTGTNYGGGIQFSGSGDLILRSVGVSNNSSSYGGGIYFNGSGGPAILTIEGDTVILNNTAQNSGGGIYINGSARLFMLKDRTTVQGNTAVSGNGGGIAVEGPARADIASPGYLNFGAVTGNTATRGGGLAIFSSGNGNAQVRFFGVDANKPVRLNSNRASESGGAIWLRGFAFATGGYDSAEACAVDALIDGNTASDGAAVYSAQDSFSRIKRTEPLHLQLRLFRPGPGTHSKPGPGQLRHRRKQLQFHCQQPQCQCCRRRNRRRSRAIESRRLHGDSEISDPGKHRWQCAESRRYLGRHPDSQYLDRGELIVQRCAATGK